MRREFSTLWNLIYRFFFVFLARGVLLVNLIFNSTSKTNLMQFHVSLSVTGADDFRYRSAGLHISQLYERSY